ncbi:MAG: guanylate kinase [Dehalococcoidia bacterium]|nr:guanylate kinase [Dehalococcoidia bacterium]
MMKPFNSTTNEQVLTTTNLVLVFSGPSGAGKDFTIDAMKERRIPFQHITTNTTRTIRQGETDGEHYNFISVPKFEELIRTNGLLEYAEVYGHYYGVPKEPVRQALAQYQDVVIKVDVQGAMSVKENLPDSILIFIMPPSIEELEKRLHERGTETEDSIKLRLATARAEIEQSSQFDYIIVSHSNRINEILDKIVTIISDEKTRVPPRQYNF